MPFWLTPVLWFSDRRKKRSGKRPKLWYPGKKCEMCGFKPGSYTALKNHRAMHRGETICPVCYRMFVGKNSLTRHLERIHRCGEVDWVEPSVLCDETMHVCPHSLVCRYTKCGVCCESGPEQFVNFSFRSVHFVRMKLQFSSIPYSPTTGHGDRSVRLVEFDRKVHELFRPCCE